ncbi:MAG: hypothetical protein AB7T63_10560 [Planctomycetota bacterium]
MSKLLAGINGSGVVAEEHLELSDGATTLSLTDLAIASDDVRVPRRATSAEYRYIARSEREEAPHVSYVVVRLDDHRRTVVVEGRSHAHVNTVMDSIEDELEEHEIIAGGLLFRTIAGVLWMFLGLLLAWMPWINRAPIPASARFGLSLAAPLIPVLIFTCPWNRWLPGTRIGEGNTISGYLVVLLPFLAPLLLPLLRVARRRWRRRRVANADRSAADSD